jgi:predicted nuclease of restriction endonuclease-like (RecB) superfamily
MITGIPIQNYAQLVQQLKQEIQTARLKAALTANVQMLTLYWKLGKTILEQQQKEGWGAKIIDRLAVDLKLAFPDMKGLSVRNLKYMRTFAEAYPQFVQTPPAQLTNTVISESETEDRSIVHTPLAQLANAVVSGSKTEEKPILQAPLAQLSWYHHITLIDRVKDPAERLFYIHKTIENGWSRNVLVHQIESNLWKRQGKAVTNFKETLPAAQSDLARELVKDPYKFDFLNLYEEYKERDLEKGLVDNLTRFLLELGSGFSFIGRQYPLEVGGKDFTIDLLFYHYKLQCFVVIELKAGDFLPEYAGKLNFYLNVIDDTLKQPRDNPSIGILICKQRDKVMAEYALRGINKPIGVSEYHLTQALPDNLKNSLPAIEQIEDELKEIIEQNN